MISPRSYADRRRSARAAKIAPPRNARAAQLAHDRGTALAVSFIGDAPLPWPTMYADSGVHYDWNCIAGLHVIIIVKPGIDALHAMREVLERSDCIGMGYPALIDWQNQELAFIVHGVDKPVQLWPVRRGTELWQRYVEPSK